MTWWKTDPAVKFPKVASAMAKGKIADFDANRDGKIGKDELLSLRTEKSSRVTASHRVNDEYVNQTTTHSLVKDHLDNFEELDADRNGAIEEAELVARFHAATDLDKDGAISLEEYKKRPQDGAMPFKTTRHETGSYDTEAWAWQPTLMRSMEIISGSDRRDSERRRPPSIWD